MSEWTKGKWTIETPCGFPYSGLYIVPVIRKDFPYYIAKIRQLRERKESEANAFLIAAAPETKQQRDDLLAACELSINLLEAVNDLHKGLKSIGHPVGGALEEEKRIIEQIQQAIAKAKEKE